MRRNGEAGQVLVTAALTLTVLLLAAGLAIDMGYLRYQKRHMQTAADSAALAAAAEIYSGGMVAAAQADASLNGFTPSTTNCPADTSSLTVGQVAMCAQLYTTSTSPLLNVTCLAAPPVCAEVTISQKAPTFFMRIAGFNSANISASATALLGPGPGCLYALGPDIAFSDPLGSFPPFSADVNLDANFVNANGCAFLSAGTIGSKLSHASALAMGDITGTCSGQCNNVTNAIQVVAPPSDPLAYLTPPALPAHPASCGYTYCAGAYSTGITITGSATFEPGLYDLGNCPSCGLSISGASGVVTGTGVTFYNSGASTISINPPDMPYYNSCTNSDIEVQFVAPSSGILFFQDANDTNSITIQMSNHTVCGGGPPDLATAGTDASYALGAIYAPRAQATIMGLSPSYNGYCSYIPRYTLVVALQVVLGGADVNFNLDDCDSPAIPYTGPATIPGGPTLPPDPIKAAVLVK